MDSLNRYYSISELLRMALSVIKSKIISPSIRIIRFPVIIRGRAFIGFGRNLTTGYNCRFEVYPNSNDKRKRLIIGNDVQVNDFVHICAIDHVEIGDNCLFASHVYISDNSHGSYSGSSDDSSPETPPVDREYVTSPVIIGKNCWLGEGVIVLPGVTIGDGCVIGAHSIVNKSIPSSSIAVGSPAKVIKKYSFEKKCWERI